MPEVIVILLFFLVSIVCVRAAAGRWPGLAHQAVSPARRQARRFLCRVEPARMEFAGRQVEAFGVRMRGTIRAPRSGYDTDVQLLIEDVTEGDDNPRPVLCSVPDWQMEDSPAFCLTAHNGPIPRRVSVLAKWVLVAAIPCSVLQMPRRGGRKLQFTVSLAGRTDHRQIACASGVIAYQNSQPGYMDVAESQQQTETQTIQLAVTSCATQGQVSQGSLAAIRQWIEDRTRSAGTEAQATETHRRLERLLEEALQLCQHGQLDTERLAQAMAGSLSIVERYGAIRLVLRAVGAEETIAQERTDRLTRVAELLQVDKNKFRALAQKSLPIDTHCVEDVRFLLGIEEGMKAEQVRQRLNAEYQKWNARVTHPDAAIRTQADRMLALIAEARNRFVDAPCQMNV